MEITKRSVIVRTQFEAQHRWKDAPASEAFLQSFHRHLFKVVMEIEVKHGERDIEFFDYLKQLNATIALRLANQQHEASCETFAEYLAFWHSKRPEYSYEGQRVRVEVSEDGENSGVVEAIC